MEEYENITVDRFKNKTNISIIFGLIASFFVFLILIAVISDPVIVISVNPSVELSANPIVAFFNLFYMVLSDIISYSYIIIVIILFFLSFIEHEKLGFLKVLKKYRFLLIVTLISGCLAHITVNLTKVLVARDRPFVDFPSLINSFSHLSDSPSFPSGHAAAAFGFLLPIVFYQDKWWKKAPILVIPIGVSFSRLYLGVHYLSDIITGMIIALAFVVCTAIIIFKTKDKEPPKISKYMLYFILSVVILVVFLGVEVIVG